MADPFHMEASASLYPKNVGPGFYIGVDLGGTNVRAGAVTPDGQLLAWREAPIEAARGPQAGLETIAGLIGSIAEGSFVGPDSQAHMLLGIGVGSTGPLDRARGCIRNPYTLPGWEDVDIVSPLRRHFGVPVALENDADAAALGEAWLGAGRDVARMVMVTIGTGVGTGTVLDGRIYRGLNGEHPEGGHLVLDPTGPPCYCGANGCWESLVAGPAIAHYAREAPTIQTSALFAQSSGDLGRIDAAMVFTAARQGDSLAREIVDRTARYIGLGLISVIMLLLPDCIVLTGGVIRSYDLLEPGLRAVIARHDIIVPAGKVRIRLAELGQHAGIYGAARAAQLFTRTETQ